MITPDSRFAIRRLPLSRIVVTEHQHRNMERVAFYVRIMLAKPDHSPGFLVVQRYRGRTYELLDGHHRFVAHVLTGRSRALCVIVDEPLR